MAWTLAFWLLAALVLDPAMSERHYVCEDETMLIDCKGKYINIHGAVWGNMNPKLCPDMEAEINGIEPQHCKADLSWFAVAFHCQGQQSCKLPARNTTFFNVDPCAGTRKYLEVSFECMETEQKCEFRGKS
ncbi:L-rhamnose-binding lectin ELEL-1-like [Strongylocentrotus purpuratus]|uniref:SUEL-type lectin domain-containing protein n=1 Tax=Strongylocentrotus purpuratus TaxID=7668 RepID=A0A7M7PH00_STRPU|nr:L-rhamnose-binding lectin ELEL-1-like [Strongylocentrotus purpuratus]